MPQYTLPISLPPVYSEDNFFVSACNRDAHDWAMRWPDWPAPSLFLYGPVGAGKTHLGQLWAARASAVTTHTIPTPESIRGNYLLEDIDRLNDERALFHLLNLIKETGHFLLLTSTVSPSQLPFTLPDLTSRLRALPAIGIAEPDDEVLAAVLRKQFADRQLKVEDDVIMYMLPRMERSFTAATNLVETLDATSLAEQRNITVPFLKRTLGY